MKTSQTSLTRMEAMLRIWEQVLFVANAEYRYAMPEKIAGAIKNWRRFREAALDLEHPFKTEDFQMPTAQQFYEYFVTFLGYQALPSMYAGWSRMSRRVYSLTPDMQRSLELTAVGRVTWEDLNPPFPFFVVSLPIPLPNPRAKTPTTNLVDTLVVQMDKERNTIQILPIGNEMEMFKPLTPELRHRAGALVKGGNIRKTLEFFERLRRDGYCYIPPSSFVNHTCGPTYKIFPDDFDSEGVIVEGLDETGPIRGDEEFVDWWRPIFRIVLGLCLHLDLGREGGQSKCSVTAVRDEFTLDPKAITAGAELCTVQCETELSADERRIHDLFREKGIRTAMREIGSHFRGGHWRRPPGKGDDPTARKSVKVSWTIVNQRRLPPHALPQGTNVIVG